MTDVFTKWSLKNLGRIGWEKLRHPTWLTSDAEWERRSAASGVFDAKNIVIFGDSQVARWPIRHTFARLPVRSRGLDGDQARGASARFEREVVPLQPTAVLLLLGTNDLYAGASVTGVAQSLRALAVRAIDARIRPTMCSVLPTTASLEGQRPSRTIAELNASLRRMSAELGIFYLDFCEELADASGRLRADSTFDGLHPNLEAYLRMTRVVLEVFYCRSGQSKRATASVW